MSGFPYEESPTTATDKTAAFWYEMEQQFGSITADLSWISDRAVWGTDLCVYLEGLSRLEISDRRNGYAAFSGGDSTERVSFAAEKGMSVKPGDDGVKLLALFRLWNAFAYYSPYLSLTDVDWDDALRQGIHTMLGAEDQRDYELALGEMMAKTGDVHAFFTGKKVAMNYYFGENYLPCHCMVLDGRPVVDAVPPEEESLRPGDVITAADGMTMTDRIAALEKVQPVPTPGKYGIWFCYSLVSAADSTAQVTVERDGVPPDADGEYPGGQFCAGKFLGKRPDGGWTNWLYCPRRPAGGGCGTADGGICGYERDHRGFAAVSFSTGVVSSE